MQETGSHTYLVRPVLLAVGNCATADHVSGGVGLSMYGINLCRCLSFIICGLITKLL